jgi:hypothetical protein
MAEKEGLLTDNAQYAILRFKKYKGPEIGRIEAHNERTKEKYDSNPDIDLSRSENNFHIIEPTDRYRKMSEALIKQYGCPKVRSDSIRVVETLITASPEFFEGKSEKEIRAFFQHAVSFLKNELGEDERDLLERILDKVEVGDDPYRAFEDCVSRLKEKRRKKRIREIQDILQMADALPEEAVDQAQIRALLSELQDISNLK